MISSLGRVRRRSGFRPPTLSGAAHRIRPSRSRRFPSPRRVRRLIISSVIVGLSRFGRVLSAKPYRKSAIAVAPRDTIKLAGRNQSQKCRISAACPSSDMNPLIIQAPGSPALVKARSPLFPEQFHAGLPADFATFYNRERANIPNLRNNSSCE
jgi:hypothetical protein